MYFWKIHSSTALLFFERASFNLPNARRERLIWGRIGIQTPKIKWLIKTIIRACKEKIGTIIIVSSFWESFGKYTKKKKEKKTYPISIGHLRVFI